MNIPSTPAAQQQEYPTATCRRPIPRRRKFCAAVIEPLEARIALAVNVWQGGASGNWNVIANWSDGIPTADDDVVVDPLGEQTVAITINSGANVANTITIRGDDSLSILNSTLTLGGGAASEISNLALTGSGTVSTFGDLTLTGISSMANSAVLTGNGTIFNTGALNFPGGGPEIRTELENTGTMTMSNGTFFVSGATAKVRVFDGGVLNFNNAAIQRPNGGLGVFIEDGGTLNSVTGTNFAGGAIFVDGGDVNVMGVPGNSLQFNAATSLHDATFNVAVGTFIAFNSNQQNAVSGTFTGTGAGQVIINGSSSFDLASDAVFNFAAGQLQFQNNAAIAGPGTLTNVGFVQGSPVLKTKVLNTGTFAPTGPITFSGADAELRILAGGTIGSTGFYLGGDATSKGLIVESGGQLIGGFASGVVPVQILAGTVKTAGSTVQFNGTASLVVANLDTTGGGAIYFQSGSTTTFGGTISGIGPAGTAVFANGAATFNVAAGGATLDFAPGMAVFHDATINGPGVLTTVGEMLISASNPILRTELRVEGTLNLTGTNPNLTFDGAGGLLRIADGGRFFGSSNVNGHGIAATNGGKGILIEPGGIFQSAGGLTVTAPFSNLGTVLVDGSLRLNGPVAQISGTTGNIALTGGTWIQHGNSFFDILNTSINTIGAGADVTIGSGIGRFPPITGLTNNAGTLRLIEGQNNIQTTSQFTNSGTIILTPGTDIDAGTFTQTATGVIEFQIAGTATNQIGRLIGTTSATLAGTARVVVTGGFAPAAAQNFPLMSFTSRNGTFAKVEGLNIGHAKVFEATYTNTDFALNSLVSAADLAVQSITIPGASVAGNDMSFSYTVKNVGPFVTPVASWTDTIYLSKDGTLDAHDIVLTRVKHTGAIAANGTYTGNVTVPLAGALPDDYRLIVVADSQGFVADTDRANNTLASTGSFSLSIPSLTPGAAFNGTIANNREQYFQVTLPAGQTPAFTFTGNVAGQAEIYESLGEVPTRANFDQAGFTAGSKVQRVTGDVTSAATYYILLHGRENAGGGQPFSLVASGIGFDLAGTSVSRGANIGKVTTTLTGSQFSPATTFTLVPASGPSRAAQAVYFHDTQSADATFDLTGLTAGSYSIVASNGGPTDSLANAFTVTSGGTPGTLSYDFSVPRYVRPPFAGAAATLTYENTGDTDLDAPIFNILAENARMRLADQPGFVAGGTTLVDGRAFTVFELLGVSGGLAGVLSPGEKGSIQVFFEPIDATAHVTSVFEALALADSNTPLDPTSLKATLNPPGTATDAWDAVFANFQAGTGGTIAGYHAMLVENANYLGQFGPVSPEATRLVAFELDQADSFGAISQRYQLGDLGRGNVAPFSLHLLADSAGNITLSEGGATRDFLRLADGSYRGAGDDAGTLTRGLGGVFTLKEPGGQKTVFRAGDGLIDYIEGSNGHRITAAWNAGGHLLSLTDNFTGDVQTFSHNTQGRIATATDAVGRVTSFTYDAGGEHLLSVITPQGSTNFTYVTGQGAAREHALASITTADGVTTAFTYDASGRLTSRTVGTGGNALTLNLSHTGPGLVTTSDSAGHELHTFLGPGGNVLRKVDALGNTTSVHFDAQGRIAGVTDPNGTTSTLAYDGNSLATGFTNSDRTRVGLAVAGDPQRIVSLTDARGGVAAFDHDANGNLLAATLPDGSSDRYEYDAKGRVIAAINGNGERTAYAYNAAGLVTQTSLADGSTVAFTYDAHRNLLTATDAEGSTTFTYDSADRVTSATYPNGKTVAITYDAAGRRSTVSDGGYTTKYSYDALGRLDTVRDAANALLVDYGYNALGQLASETRGNGTSTAYTYDAAGHTATIVHRDATSAVIAQFSYTRDTQGRVSSATSADGTTTYAYDLKGQLTNVALPGGRTIAYAYDAEGNRTTVADSAGVPENYATNSGDQYTTAGAETLTYDRAGRVVARTADGVTTTYTYDAAGHLTGIISPGASISYDYDAIGNRIGKTENGVRTDFANDPLGLGVVFGEYTGATTVNYATGHGIAARATAGGTEFYHFDATGNTSALSGAAGTSVASYTYLPFGKITAQTGAGAQPFTFNGKFGVQDEAGDLFHMRARTYDAGPGRFTTRDPLSFSAGDTNLYRFVANDPVNRADPSGLEDIFLGVNADVINGVGVTASAGGFLNVDDLWDFGGFYSGGTGTGLSDGLSVTGGVSADISGLSHNVTVSSGGVTGTVSTNAGASVAKDGLQITGASGGAVIGTGDVFSGTITTTSTVKLSPRALMNALGYPPPPKVNRSPEYVFGNKLDPLVAKNGNSDLFNNLYQNEIDAHKTPQQALLDTITFLRKNGIYDPKYNPRPHPVETIRPLDPNNVVGPAGAGADEVPDIIAPGQVRFDGFVNGIANFPYKIEFENKAEASAPAQVVKVTQTLDADLDLSTFAFTGFGFGPNRVDVPAGANGTSFHTIFDATATLGVLVKIDAALNTQTRRLDVTFTSLDPATNDVPLDPFAGFLPPDDATGSGDGFLTYTVKPKAGLANGTNFTAIASIVFDTEAAIATPTVTNTLDAIAPTSKVAALPAATSRTSFPVRWTGSDNAGGSGLAGVSLYFTDNGGPLQSAVVAGSESAFLSSGAVGHTYRFFSQAIDNVGNSEALAATPDATITFVAPTFLDVGRKRTFTDSDGDTYTVTHSGPGTTKVALLDPDGDGKGPIDFIQTDSSTTASKVTVTVKKNKNGGDGAVSIGDAIINGALGAFTAKASDLIVNGFTATGPVKTIAFRDALRPEPLLADPHITIGGTNVDKLVLTARHLADGIAISTPGILAALATGSIGDGKITAAALGKLTTTLGAMNADLAIAGGAGPIALKLGANAGAWSAASFKTVTLGGTLNADIDSAGAIGAVTVKSGNLNGDIDATGKIASISVKAGALTGQLTAASFGAVTVTGGGFTGLLASRTLADDLGRTPALAKLTITGGDFAGAVSVLGSVGPVTVKESKTLVGGAFSGGLTAGKVGAFTLVGGDFSGTLTSTTPATDLAKTAALSRVAITGGSLTGGINVLGSVGPVTVKEDKTRTGGGFSGDVTARNVGAFTLVGGNFGGTLTATGTAADLGKTLALGGLSVTGGDITGDVRLLGGAGAVIVKADKAGTGGNLTGVSLTAAKIAALTVGKNVTNSLILAGTSLGADHLPGGGDDTFGAGMIGAVNIGSKVGRNTFGTVLNSVIAAGLSNPDGIYNNGDDAIVGATPAEKLTSKIASLIIKGTNITGSYFATGKFTAKPKVGGVAIDPGTDVRFKVG